MKKLNVSQLSRTELKEVFGGYLHPIQCPRGCPGEALIRCPDGSTTMTNFICIGGKCEVAAMCKPIVIGPIEPIDPEPILTP